MINPMVNPYALPQQQPGMAPQMPPQGVPHPGMAQAGGAGALSPEMIDAVLGLNRQGAQQQGINRSLKLADALRADAGQQLQGRQAGRVYQAPGMANLAANVMAGYKARGMEEDAALRQQNMGAETQAAMRRYFDAATNRKPQALGHMGDEGE